MKKLTMWASCLVLALAAFEAGAARYHVAPTGIDGANDGLTWGSAYKTISNGIAHATTAGDEVMVSNGTYVLTATIALTNAVKLISTNGAAATVINGNGIAQCVNVSFAGAVVDGFTIIKANGTLAGGGVYCGPGLVSSCVITGNTLTGGSDANGGAGAYVGNNGVVSNCLIAKNSAATSGGGVRVGSASGLVTHCRILDNYSDKRASAACLSAGGTLRNCLIKGNASTLVAPVLVYGATMQNCTVADNLCPVGNAIDANGTAVIVNSIIRNNRYQYLSPTNFPANPAVTFSCLEFTHSGNGNISADPGFWKDQAGEYALTAGSPCRNTGTNQAWMAAATDLAGSARVVEAAPDMGAYEFTTGALACAVAASPSSGLAPLSVSLTARTAGTNVAALYYRWSYTNSAVIDAEGADKQVVSRAYPAGLHTITLTASNEAGEVAANTYLLKVSAPTVYVARIGSNSSRYPFADWSTAASNLQDAVNAACAGAVVLLTNGTYPATEVLVTNAITVTSVNGPEFTTISGGGRSFFLDDARAIVEWLTLRHTGGASSLNGGVLYLRFGTVRNSVITGGNLNAGGSSGGGAGIYLQLGMVSNCTIAANLSSQGQGAGIRVAPNTAGAGFTSLVTHSVLRHNTNNTSASYALGAGANLDGGIIRNCLVIGNAATLGGAGVVLYPGAVMENCTVSGNSCPGNNSAAYPGALGVQNGAIVLNSIVKGNIYTVSAPSNFGSATTPSVNYSDLDFTWAGTGNQTNDPLFLDPAATNYTLAAASPCRDAGSNQAWMASAVDQAGTPRVNGSAVDLGAYEFSLGPLTAAIGATPDKGLAPLSVALSATVSGQNTNGLYYWWSFTNAAVVDAAGADKQTVTNVFIPGSPVVTLTVSNSIGEVVQDTQSLKISAPTCYVARLGWNTATFPYSDWATAASNLPEAVIASQAGCVVIVTNGTYPLPSQVTVNEAIEIRSVNGAAVTVMDGGLARRCFVLQSPGALLKGLTISRGTGDQGAGVYLEYGTVADCVVTGCVGTSGGTTAGGPVYILYGTLTNCYLARNSGYEYGGAVRVYQGGGLVTHCTIVSNRISSTGAIGSGGGIHADYGRVRNCLIYKNYSPVSSAGIYVGPGALMENCTVVSNTSPGNAGPAVGTAAGASVLNSIIWGNLYTNATPSSFGGPPTIAFTRTEFAWAGDGNTTADPIFVNPAAGDFTLRGASPCVNTGSNVAWMAEAVDLAGSRRIIGSAVDMGAYECQRVAGTVIWVR